MYTLVNVTGYVHVPALGSVDLLRASDLLLLLLLLYGGYPLVCELNVDFLN